MNSSPTTQTVTIGSTVVSSDNRKSLVVIATPQELLPEPGMFVLESFTGYRTFAQLTGKTRMAWGMACPTLRRFEIETVVIDGAIWGKAGNPIMGTMLTRPENLKATAKVAL